MAENISVSETMDASQAEHYMERDDESLSDDVRIGVGEAEMKRKLDATMPGFFKAMASGNTFGGAGPMFDEHESEDDDDESGGTNESLEDRRIALRKAAFEELREVGERLRVISANQLLSEFKKGRAAEAGGIMFPQARQKLFAMEGTELMASLEDMGNLCDRMAKGPVVTAVLARTGLGKTRVFPAMCAKRGGLRVLLLEPNAINAAQAKEGLVKQTNVRTRWSKHREEMVVIMTYADFCGHHQSKNGQCMLDQFDVVLLDEGDSGDASVYVTKAILATRYNEKFSIVVLSGTNMGEDVQALNNTAPVKYLNGDLISMARDGALFSSSRRKDQTMLIFSTDQEVLEVAQLIRDQGMVAYTLDSASRPADCESVFRSLEGSSINVRYVVCTNKFGTGVNLPVRVVYTDAMQHVCEVDEFGDPVIVKRGLRVSQVKQHAGRVGRQLASEATVYAFHQDEQQPDVELYDEERLKAYLLLLTVRITPLKSVLPDLSMLPYGLTEDVAKNVLAINLPPVIALRYFNHNGALPASYSSAMRHFSHNEHYFISSADDRPVGSDRWRTVGVGGFYGLPVSEMASVKVPVVVDDDETMAKLQVISALASGKVAFTVYVPDLSDNETSGDESMIPSPKMSRKMLPRAVVNVRKALPPPPPRRYAYDVPEEQQASLTRMLERGVYSGRVAEQLEFGDSDRVLDVTDVMTTYDVNKKGRDRVKVYADAEISENMELLSPGGTVIANVRRSAWDAMIAGECLSRFDAVSLFKGIQYNADKFAKGQTFADWNNAWLSIMKTLASIDVLEVLAQNNLMSVATTVFQLLIVRYYAGVEQLIAGSYVKNTLWFKKQGKFLARLDKLKKQGNVEIAQSEIFLRRIHDIRVLAVGAVEALQRQGWFRGEIATMIQSVVGVKYAGSRATNMDDVYDSMKKGSSKYLRIS